MQQIGRYQIVSELGRGAMGVVFRAQDPAIGRTIAIKTIRLTDLTDPAERERLRDRLFREAQSAGILSHPNIVTIYDILEEQGMAYIFMEFVNGPALEKVLAAEHTPDKHTLLGMLRQTAHALDYAHRKGIVHRDIKPANIMIHDDGAAKITDFGVAKIVSQQMTQSGTMMGTPSYMSPEQVQGGTVDGRADQFALSVIAYEMLTGEKPFIAEYLPSLLYKICREDPTPPQRLNTTLTTHAEAVLSKALAKNPDDRFATCTEFIGELERACNANPDWIPLPRGSSQNLPTIMTTASPALGIPVAEPARPAPPPKAPAAPPPVAPTNATAPATPSEPRPPARLDEAPESHTIRNVVLALASIVIVGLIVLVAQKWNNKPPVEATPPVATAPPANPGAETTPKPGPAKPEPAKPDTPPAKPEPEAEKPSPVVRPNVPVVAPDANRSGAERPVQLASTPTGARIVVDSNPALACTTPCQLLLGPGRHVLTATMEGHRDAQRIFETPRDASLSIQFDRQSGTLSVSTTPAGATVLINGQARPEKTPAVFTLPVGSYKLQVQRGNVKTDEETVQIRDGVLSQRRYTLE